MIRRFLGADDSPKIEYTVKELLDTIRQEQTQGFADMLARLDGKADKADVAELRSDLIAHRNDTNRRLSALESSRREHNAVDNYDESNREHRVRSWQLGAATVSSAAAIVLAVIGIVH